MYEDEDDDEDYYHKDNAQNQYDKYFKFDPSLWEKYGNWLNDLTEGIKEISPNMWIIYSGYTPKSNSYFVGNNIQKKQIYKSYIIVDTLNIEYRKHIQSHVKHFLSQPHYYKGLYDILN